jgi:hypothetical protein
LGIEFILFITRMLAFECNLRRMKKLSFLIIGFLLLSVRSFACEICGCSHSNFQIGLLPSFNKGFVGFRYSLSTFNSRVKDEPSEFSHDLYQTAELWGGYNFKKFQVMAFTPYIHSRKESDDGVTISNGLGDVMLLVNYNILNSASLSENENTTMKHELYVGGGIKLPTGLNEINVSDPEFNIGDFNSQGGTGSVDFILNATHNFMWNKSGIVTNIAYRINTANKQDFKFGNRAYLNSSYYYTFTKSNTKIKPNAGLNFESNAVNTFEGTKVEDSKGYNLNTTIGVNVLYKKIGFTAMAFIPVSQNNFDGQTKLKSRVMVGVTYSL